MTLQQWQSRCLAFVAETMDGDAAHDISHIKRVIKNTVYLTEIENVNFWITLPAACLHDCVAVAKDSDLRSRASRLAADEALRFLKQEGYPAQYLEPIHHAIEAHSYSAGIPPRTPEAKVVQDADRLEALGAIGIARCLLTGNSFGAALYSEHDPFCDRRAPDERAYIVDHFYEKLLGLPDTMQTVAGREEARRRAQLMETWLEELGREIGAHSHSGPPDPGL